jgi:hypothetical protein
MVWNKSKQLPQVIVGNCENTKNCKMIIAPSLKPINNLEKREQDGGAHKTTMK